MHSTRNPLDRLITALTNGVHWLQVSKCQNGLNAKSFSLFGRGGLSERELQRLVHCGIALMQQPPNDIREWMRNSAGAGLTESLVATLEATSAPNDAALPVHAFLNAVQDQKIEVQPGTRAIANLMQVCLAIHWDGDLLQDLFELYAGIGAQLSFKELRFPTTEAALMPLARACAARSNPKASPYGSDVPSWHITLAKVLIWSSRYMGVRNDKIIAAEVLADPEIKPLIPRLKALPPKRVAFCGYSLMMNVNWSTYAAWNHIASEALKSLNPHYEFGSFQTGGLQASYALKKHLPDVLAWRPTETWLIMNISNADDDAAFRTILSQLKSAGCKVCVPDTLRPFRDEGEMPLRRKAASEALGCNFYPFLETGRSHPDWRYWGCLDLIHMDTPGHVFYAKELLKIWAAEG
jgi:hypothetical protein